MVALSISGGQFVLPFSFLSRYKAYEMQWDVRMYLEIEMDLFNRILTEDHTPLRKMFIYKFIV